MISRSDSSLLLHFGNLNQDISDNVNICYDYACTMLKTNRNAVEVWLYQTALSLTWVEIQSVAPLLRWSITLFSLESGGYVVLMIKHIRHQSALSVSCKKTRPPINQCHCQDKPIWNGVWLWWLWSNNPVYIFCLKVYVHLTVCQNDRKNVLPH